MRGHVLYNSRSLSTTVTPWFCEARQISFTLVNLFSNLLLGSKELLTEGNTCHEPCLSKRLQCLHLNNLASAFDQTQVMFRHMLLRLHQQISQPGDAGLFGLNQSLKFNHFKRIRTSPRASRKTFRLLLGSEANTTRTSLVLVSGMFLEHPDRSGLCPQQSHCWLFVNGAHLFPKYGALQVRTVRAGTSFIGVESNTPSPNEDELLR